jgi:hypothetical protein
MTANYETKITPLSEGGEDPAFGSNVAEEPRPMEPRMLVHRANTIHSAIRAAHGVELDIRAAHGGGNTADLRVAHDAHEPGYKLYEYLVAVLRTLDVTGIKDFTFALNIKEHGLMPALDRTLRRVRQYYELLAWSEGHPSGYTFFTFDVPGAEIPDYKRFALFGRLSEYENQCRQRSHVTGVLVDSYTVIHQEELLFEAARKIQRPIALISRTLREGPSAIDSYEYAHAPRFLITKVAPLVREQQ